MAQTRRQNSMLLAVAAGRMEAGAARKTFKDAFFELEMAGHLASLNLYEAKQLSKKQSTVKVEKLYAALLKGGLLGKATVAETE